MDTTAAIAYWKRENLDQYISVSKEKEEGGVYDSVSGQLEKPLPADLLDLVRIHQLIRKRKSFTVLEFGVGFSTIIIADALQKNQKDWEGLGDSPKIRNRFLFQCFSVDSSEKWLDKAKANFPKHLA